MVVVVMRTRRGRIALGIVRCRVVRAQRLIGQRRKLVRRPGSTTPDWAPATSAQGCKIGPGRARRGAALGIPLPTSGIDSRQQLRELCVSWRVGPEETRGFAGDRGGHPRSDRECRSC